jgi:hypothetical protein
VPRFIAAFLAMLLELTVENCVVWLVSAYDERKAEHSPGLQVRDKREMPEHRQRADGAQPEPP